MWSRRAPALEAFQAQTDMVAPTEGGDSETSQYMAISQELSAARAQLTALQSRLTSGSTELSNDPTDPDLQILAALKEKLSTSEAAIEACQGHPWLQQSEDDGRTGKSRLDSQTDRARRRRKCGSI